MEQETKKPVKQEKGSNEDVAYFSKMNMKDLDALYASSLASGENKSITEPLKEAIISKLKTKDFNPKKDK